MSVDITVRFPQIDVAGIMFFPRYYELLLRYFPDSPISTTPLAMRTRFLRSNRMGDRIRLSFSSDAESWHYSGTTDGKDQCRFESDRSGELQPQPAARVSEPEPLGTWACGSDGRMQLSRSFEFLNDSLETFFEQALRIQHAEMLRDRRVGIPTIQFNTCVTELPRLGDSISMSTQPIALGTKSMTLRHQLLRGDDCLIENEHIVVFIEFLEQGFRSIPVPDDMRAAFEDCIDVAT